MAGSSVVGNADAIVGNIAPPSSVSLEQPSFVATLMHESVRSAYDDFFAKVPSPRTGVEELMMQNM
jgi:hypothetical protein